MINVLDKGYVRLIPEGTTQSEITIVNSARVSYDKATDKIRPSDERLIKFLIDNGHWSPFRHAHVQFEIHAPLMVARQHWKYVVGSSHNDDAWNESSRRYVTEKPVFYVPDVWRSAPENKKQGSGKPVDEEINNEMLIALQSYIQLGENLYNEALEKGVCAEQARLFLPAYGMYVRYYWTCSLQAVINFLQQRLEHDAQVEIQEYAKAVKELLHKQFPVTFNAIFGENA